MTLDTSIIVEQLKQLDIKSLMTGAVVARTIEAAVVKTVKTVPIVIIAILRSRAQALIASGKIDEPTKRLLKAYARATFVWADEELPDDPTPEQLAAIVDKLARVPILGAIVRADREGAQKILQAGHAALNQEAKAEAAALEETNGKKTPAAVETAAPTKAGIPPAQG